MNKSRHRHHNKCSLAMILLQLSASLIFERLGKNCVSWKWKRNFRAPVWENLVTNSHIKEPEYSKRFFFVCLLCFWVVFLLGGGEGYQKIWLNMLVLQWFGKLHINSHVFLIKLTLQKDWPLLLMCIFTGFFFSNIYQDNMYQ